jgi:hypothetical protein
MAVSKYIGGIDEALKRWATPRQAEYIDKVNELGSARMAARAFNVDASAVQFAIKQVERKAAKAEYSPSHDMTRPVPEGYNVHGVSTYYDADGVVRGQWVKSKADDLAREAAVKAAYAAMAEELPKVAAVDAPANLLADLLNMFTVTDYHLNMRAEARISGEDWNHDIAEALLFRAFEHMVRSAPRAATAILNQLGDFLHHDAALPVTPTHGHILDASCSTATAAKVATRLIRRIISLLLEYHETVIVVMGEGNHDPISSVWLRLMFKSLYENEPRVQIVDSETPYYAVQHGKVMLGFHHGHLAKNEALPLLFATRFPEMWGATKFRVAHTGHRHHKQEREHSGMEVLQHPTLAAADAYANRGGWDALRRTFAITYHAEHGEVARNTVTPGMLAA